MNPKGRMMEYTGLANSELEPGVKVTVSGSIGQLGFVNY